MNKYLAKIYKCIVDDEFEPLLKETRRYLSNYLAELSIQIHPLGFYAIKLGQPEKGINIRLHIWNNKLQPQSMELMVHNHIFDMKSFVLKGEIFNKEYELMNAEVCSNENQFYKVQYENNQSSLIKLETTGDLIETKKIAVKEGSSYVVSAGVFHESIVTCEYTATILFTIANSVESPKVAAKSDLGPIIRFERSTPNEGLLHEVIDEFLVKVR
jgi:hypothetical protein